MRLKLHYLSSLLLLAFGSVSQAHTVHQSTAEVEYNEKTQKLEVSLTVFLNDLEVALIRQCECEMRIDKSPQSEFDQQALLYLQQNFVVTDGNNKTAALHWIGREIDDESAKSDEPKVTLFFEVSLSAGLSDKRLKHSVFHDRFKDQSNLLLFRKGSRKVEWAFTPDAAVRKLDLPEP